MLGGREKIPMALNIAVYASTLKFWRASEVTWRRYRHTDNRDRGNRLSWAARQLSRIANCRRWLALGQSVKRPGSNRRSK